MPESFCRLKPLPLGRVTARGWMRDQLSRSRDGMGGHLDELEPNMIANPYVNKQSDEQWGAAIKAGWGAEISGNYWYGLIKLAYTLDDEGLKAKAEKWVDAVLALQEEDGYMGAYTHADDRMDDYNAWGTSCGMSALMAFYSATGREDVLKAVHRCMLWFCDNWAGDKKTRYAGVKIVNVMSQVYRLTGDERLRRFIDEYFDFLDRRDLYLNSIRALRRKKLTYNSNHAAAYANMCGTAAMAYEATGSGDYLDAAVNSARKVMKAVLPTGGIASNTEYIMPITMGTETEYCTYAFFQRALLELTAATGDAAYMETVERIAFNGAQGARKKDEKAIAYFTSPNQIFSTDSSTHYCGDMGVYAPCYPTSCCPVTSVWIMPDYVSGMGLTDGEGGAYVAGYGPARMDFGDLVLTQETRYPFGERIVMTVECAKPVSRRVHLRIPAWCGGASIRVNGEEAACERTPGSFAAVERVWENGDVIELMLPMAVSVSRIDDSDGWRHYPLCVTYGPLVFSLPIPEVWTAIKGHPRTPLPEGWSWYNVEPKLVWDDRGDVYEQQGLRKYNISWNVALDEALDVQTVRVERAETDGYVWENPPIRLIVPGWKAPFSYAPYIRRTHEVYESPIDVTDPLTLELVPYGCTALRITCFPRANMNGSEEDA